MSTLSLVDVIALKNDPSRESRIAVAGKVCDEFNARAFSPEEQVVAAEIFRMLAKDAEIAIRQTLAEKLKHNSRLPQETAFMLANDVLQVALPVLQYSPVLTEDDLISITRNCKEIGKLVAITKRDVLTPALSHALLDHKQATVSESLLQNTGAMLSTENMEELVLNYGHSDSLMSALIARDELPAVVADKIVATVSEALKTKLIEMHGEHIHVLSEAVEDAQEELMVKQISQPASQPQKDAFAGHLHRSERLSSSIVIRSICLGDVEFFIQSMVKLTGWKLERIQTILEERDMDGLRRLYRAGGLPESIQDATLAVLVIVLEDLRRGGIPEDPSFSGRIIEHIVGAGYDRTVNNMSYLLTLVGKPPKFSSVA